MKSRSFRCGHRRLLLVEMTESVVSSVRELDVQVTDGLLDALLVLGEERSARVFGATFEELVREPREETLVVHGLQLLTVGADAVHEDREQAEATRNFSRSRIRFIEMWLNRKLVKSEDVQLELQVMNTLNSSKEPSHANQTLTLMKTWCPDLKAETRLVHKAALNEPNSKATKVVLKLEMEEGIGSRAAGG